MKKLSLLFLFGLMAALLAFRTTPAPAPKTNILYLVADDAGRDMSAYGTKWVNTPAFRPHRAGGAAVQQRLHSQRQVRTVAGRDAHGPQPLAVGRGHEPRQLFPRLFQDLPRGPGRPRLLRGPHGQRLGAWPGPASRRLGAAGAGEIVQQVHDQASRDGHLAQRLRRQFCRFCETGRRQALGVLDWLHRAAPGV